MLMMSIDLRGCNMIVSGYEIRKIRGTREFALVLHILGLEGSFTTLRLVSEDPAELARYVSARADKFGEDFPGGDLRKCVTTMRGTSSEGPVTGHSVAIDEWNGLRGLSWVDVRGTAGGRINVPVVCFSVPFHEIECRDGEDLLTVYREYTRLTMTALRKDFTLRSILKIRETENGYELASEPTVDTASSQELRA
jgi:hypothetical protein